MKPFLLQARGAPELFRGFLVFLDERIIKPKKVIWIDHPFLYIDMIYIGVIYYESQHMKNTDEAKTPYFFE